MAVAMASSEQTRAPLTRDYVLSGAVRYVDEHGLEALSMHKLGAELGVKAMSLYKHVANKDDLLDGIVEQLWAQIPIEPASADWREAIKRLAAALRDLVHRHPRAASLLTSRQTILQRPLEIFDALLAVMRDSRVPEQCAVALLRTIFPYAIGYALAELAYPDSEDGDDEVTRIRRITNMLSPQAPDDLVRTALLVCGECDMNAQFDIGLDLMIRGLDAYLEEAATASHR
ncbi:TetR/AcrR family transcriptional regulator [Sciscionella marina]|uniref:TetR/AcrR family transcriptional regulator n=1 Tax=Sciscionella marina TaxID=508770 RepID=UPI00037984EC|nr:TetR/AcrR family transcriptional regulator C-terminal domain-containing protein [Sciscionella marina]